jgi:hypothetical protein
MKTIVFTIAILIGVFTAEGCAPYYTSAYCFGPQKVAAHSQEAYNAYCEMPLADKPANAVSVK